MHDTRQTIPPPVSRNAVELGRPAPLSEDDGPVVPKLGLYQPYGDEKRGVLDAHYTAPDAGRIAIAELPGARLPCRLPGMINIHPSAGGSASNASGALSRTT